MMIHNIYSSIKIDLTRTRNLRHLVFILGPAFQTSRLRGGKGAHTCSRRPELLDVELGLRGVVAIHRESAYVTPGRWGDAAAIVLRGASW